MFEVAVFLVVKLAKLWERFFLAVEFGCLKHESWMFYWLPGQIRDTPSELNIIP